MCLHGALVWLPAPHTWPMAQALARRKGSQAPADTLSAVWAARRVTASTTTGVSFFVLAVLFLRVKSGVQCCSTTTTAAGRFKSNHI